MLVGCDVAVDNLVGVGGLQRHGAAWTATRNASGHPEHAARAAPQDHLGQTLPLDVLHGDPAVRAGPAGTVELDDVGVTDGQHGLHRPDEPPHRVLHGVRPEELSGPRGGPAPCPVAEDDARAARGQLLLDLGTRDLLRPGPEHGHARPSVPLGGLGLGRLDAVGRFQIEAQLGVGQPEHVPGLEFTLGDRLAVDQRAAAAAGVGHADSTLSRLQATMVRETQGSDNRTFACPRGR